MNSLRLCICWLRNVALVNLRRNQSKDRIVVDLQDRALSERLQLDPELTLEKAITFARNAEMVKVQQKVLREPGAGSNDLEVCVLSKPSHLNKHC